MTVQAGHRIQRTIVYFLAGAVAFVLSIVLFIRVGAQPARIVLEAISAIAITLLFSRMILEKWLWKTKLGSLLGFPPNYSGIWSGEIERIKKSGTKVPDTDKVKVTIKQTITQVEWNQCGFDENGRQTTESHFILGEVIDYHKKWDGIAGVYQVRRSNGKKDEGMSLLCIDDTQSKITGFYCGINGHVGKISLKKGV